MDVEDGKNKKWQKRRRHPTWEIRADDRLSRFAYRTVCDDDDDGCDLADGGCRQWDCGLEMMSCLASLEKSGGDNS